MRKVVIFPIKVCFRTIWNHPFLVGMLCFLAFLYKSFPFVFSILVSVSPILVCTTALLGTLLSYAQPNIPEFEWKENTIDHVVPLETRDAIRVESDNSYFTGRCNDQERDKVDHSTRSEVHRGKRFGGVLVGGVSGQMAREFYENKNEDKFSDAELVENQYSPTSKVDDETLEFDNDKSVDSFDSRRVNLDSPPGSWKRREEALYSGSDGAESSSPDASIADIMPMLDELHPLLEEDNPQPIGLSQDVSHAPSESSTKSSESDDESDDISEDQEEVEVAEDDDEEEEIQDTEGPKSVITWTEEDQRNLMDLGTSELEMNQRLESVIARRKSQKNMSFKDEKSLIDLETTDFIPPISTARQNPFDLPNDNYGPELPPIPGSAPSILLPRFKRNPFDLLYEPSEEKPDLTRDTFEQEIITSQPKETFFRRHESFNVGPSIFGLNKKDTRFRPYFVPDVMADEGTSYPPFQRHPSDLSDSKASSVLETESQGSIEDLEYKNLNEEDVEDKNLTDEPMPELISKIEHATDDIGHESQSSEEVECLVLGASDKRDIELDDTDVKQLNTKNHHEVVPIVFQEETTIISTKLDPSKICSNSATSEQKCSSQSSSSSSEEEEGERIYPDKVEVKLTSEEAMFHIETISEHPNVSNLNITKSSVEESSHLEPIYDASPPSIKKNTSIASDMVLESETGHAPETEPMENNQDTEKSITKKERIFSSVDSKELRLTEVITNTNDLHVAKLEISKHDEVAPPVLVADIQLPTKEATPVSMEKAGTTNVSKVDPESVLKPSNTKMETEESESSNNGSVHTGSSSNNASKIDHKVVKQEDKVTITEKSNHEVDLTQETSVASGDVVNKKDNDTIQVPVNSKENVDN
ncbi:hypothetical protein EJD97_003037 [Solanum chilense]|uniref:Uncharacterized protein n=1 Tax=Solanum chilense TaxID=4083 RepID=A0A6N2BW55_SOLCI|nr:hypothetical protein EJD97_003037 [Solanum chilense]